VGAFGPLRAHRSLWHHPLRRGSARGAGWPGNIALELTHGIVDRTRVNAHELCHERSQLTSIHHLLTGEPFSSLPPTGGHAGVVQATQARDLHPCLLLRGCPPPGAVAGHRLAAEEEPELAPHFRARLCLLRARRQQRGVRCLAARPRRDRRAGRLLHSRCAVVHHCGWLRCLLLLLLLLACVNMHALTRKHPFLRTPGCWGGVREAQEACSASVLHDAQCLPRLQRGDHQVGDRLVCFRSLSSSSLALR
jgi:hypothetical protein